MKKFLAALLFASTAALGQAPKLPPGYSLQTDGASEVLRADFDGDRTPDVFCVAEKEGEDGGVFIAIMGGAARTLVSKPLTICCGSLEAKGRIIKAASKGMRGFSYYTFRWDAAAKDFRLIGYDTESFGNAANDGSGTSSLNLLTGDFIAEFNSYDDKKDLLQPLPTVRKKITVGRRIYLKGFGDDADEWVSNLAHSHFPKAVQ